MSKESIIIPKYLSGFRSKLPVLQRDFFLNMCHKPISTSANCVFLSDFHVSHLSKSSLLRITIYLFDVCVSSIFSTGHRHIFQGYMDDNNKSLDFYKMSDGQKVVTRIIMLKKKRGREWKGNEVYQNEYENEAEGQGSSPDLK